MVSAITLGVALVIILVGFALTVTILLIKTKIKFQTTATTVTLVWDKVSSKRDEAIEDRSITTNENIAYAAVHLPKMDSF